MRKLMWFSIGFTAACGIGAYLLTGAWLLLLSVPAAAGAVVFLLMSGKRKNLRIPVVILIGCFTGLLWFFIYDVHYISTARAYDSQTVTASVEITDYSYETDYGVAADGRIALENKTFRTRIYLYRQEPLSPGDIVTGDFHLRLTADGGAKESTYHQGEGIFLLAYADEDTVVIEKHTGENGYFAARLRRKIAASLDAAFHEDTRAFAKALLIGDTSEIDYRTDTALKLSGIRHVVAVSGLHISVLFSFLYPIAGKRRFLTAVIGLPVLLLFAAVAGFSPSVTRAVIMQSMMILALLLNREYDPPTALSFAVLVMLAVNPLAVTSVSLQLSAGCMAGIFLFSERIRSYLLSEKRLGPAKGSSLKARLARWFAGSVSVSVSAMAVTIPLSAYYFGTVSIISVLTNLLTLWAVSLAFYGIILVCIASTVFLPAGQAAAWLVSWLIRFVKLVTGALAKFPLAAVYTCNVYIQLWLLFAYVLLALFFLARKKRPMLFAGCLTAGLLLSIGISWAEPRLEDYRVSVLDVGQGQSILVQSKGEYYLVDCGGDTGEAAADTAAQMLLSQGITRIDGLILTHYDEDHAGGVEALLSRIKVDSLFLPDIAEGNNIRQSLTSVYADAVTWVEDETVLDGENLKVSLIPGENSADDNESGLCVLFQIENCDILITGDRSSTGERQLLQQTELPELELLVVGHHGSGSSTCFDLLAATKPKNAVISVGAGNSYGHPAGDVLKRLYLFGCAVYRTDMDGTIIFRG